jgi:hypothetical protein
MKAVAFLLLLVLLIPTCVQADAIVTACVSDTQAGSGVNLSQALQSGGTIYFNRPANSVIRVTQSYVLRTSTLIDGSSLVTLDGHGLRARLLYSTADRIVLRRLTIRGIAMPLLGLGRMGGSVLTASNAAELDQVSIETSEAPIAARGYLTVSDSVFVGNSGYALSIDGAAWICAAGSPATRPESFLRAAISTTAHSLDRRLGLSRLVRSTRPWRSCTPFFSGTRGASAISMSQRAMLPGPITVTLHANRFEDNDGGAQAGAIGLFDVAQMARDRGMSAAMVNRLSSFPPAAFTLAYNRFINNRGVRDGAANLDLHKTPLA